MSNLLSINDLLEFGVSIPNSNELYVSERIDMIITRNERIIIEAMLGVAMTDFVYLELELGTPTEQKVANLWNGTVVDNYRFRGMKDTVLSLIYFLLIEDRVIFLSASGVMNSVSENSENVDPNAIMNKYFNNYVNYRNDTYNYLEQSVDWVDKWDNQYFRYVSIRSDYNF